MNNTLLSSTRLKYRLFKNEDFTDLFEILGNDNVCEYLPGETTFNPQQVQKWLDHFINSFSVDKPNLIYALTFNNSDKVIGYVGLAYVKEFEKNEIMFAINEDYWHQGIASEAAQRMKELAKELNLNEIIALADIDNIYSQKVLLKLGYKYLETIELWGLTLKYYNLNIGGA